MGYSVSEYFRLIHERDLLLEKLKTSLPKKDKEYYLQELRTIDKELRVDSGNYNSTDFGKVTK